MPCCAFAAFILGQILIGFDGFKRFVLRRDAAIVPDNAATEWRLIDARSPDAAPAHTFYSGRSVRWIAIAASLEMMLAIGAFYGIRAHLGHHHGTHQPLAHSADTETARAPVVQVAR
jgi:hypothetical protein